MEQHYDTVPWTTQQTALGIVLTLVPWIALALGLSLLGNQSPHTAPLTSQEDVINAVITFIISSIIEGAFLITPLYFGVRAYRSLALTTPSSTQTSSSPWREALRAFGFRGFNALQALALIIVFIIAILAVDNLYQYVITLFHLNLQTNDQVLLERSKSAPYTTYATLLVAVFVAPFCEEIFFRGFIFTGISKAMPVWLAMIVSSFIFAFAHADLGSFAVLFIIGIALAFLRWRTHSLWPGIFLHMLNNGLGALAVVLTMNGIIKP